MTSDTPAPAPAPVPAGQVGETRFEGWLSDFTPTPARSPRYSKQDMRDCYWAGYTEACEAGAAPAAPVVRPQVRAPAPLTEADMLDCVRSVGVPAPMGLTRDRGPYEVTEPTWFLVQLVRAIERKIGAAAQGGEHV